MARPGPTARGRGGAGLSPPGAPLLLALAVCGLGWALLAAELLRGAFAAETATAVDATRPPRTPLEEAVRARSELDTFAGMLQVKAQADGRGGVLQTDWALDVIGADVGTVFAPTDAAWENFFSFRDLPPKELLTSLPTLGIAGIHSPRFRDLMRAHALRVNHIDLKADLIRENGTLPLFSDDGRNTLTLTYRPEEEVIEVRDDCGTVSTIREPPLRVPDPEFPQFIYRLDAVVVPQSWCSTGL